MLEESGEVERAGQRRPVCHVADRLGGESLKDLKDGRQGQFKGETGTI